MKGYCQIRILWGNGRSPGARALLHFFRLTSVLLCVWSAAAAQDITATLKADSNHIVIGDFLKATLTVRFPNDYKVVMPAPADTVGKMEWVRSSKVDTSLADHYLTLSQVYTVSAYDSGKFRLGPQQIVYKNPAGVIDTLLTDSVLVSVTTLPVDTTKAIKPIKSPLKVPYSWNEFIPYFIGVGVAALIAVALIYYLRRRKKKPPVVIERPKPRDPPHLWAKKELKKLEEEKLWQKDRVKEYYSRLTDILRLYLEYRFRWFALESTTEEISGRIGDYDIGEEAREKLHAILASADLVKFAKLLPVPNENDQAMRNAVSFVELTAQAETRKEEPAQA